MSKLIGIVGPSGSGKSTSLESMNPETTYVINILGKDLPFRGSREAYNSERRNYFSSDNYGEIIQVLKAISEKRPEIDTIIIDDAGFIMQTEFFARAGEKGYDKFSEIGQHMFQVLNTAKNLRDDLHIVFLFHAENVFSGQIIVDSRIKTIGRMLDDKYEPQALMTVCLFTRVEEVDGVTTYNFVTNKFEKYPAKSPKGLFEDNLIPNDLNLVINKLKEYYG
jgi:ABC-type dipeptide/oligopeptide/nickel transport system ATPase component